MINDISSFRNESRETRFLSLSYSHYTKVFWNDVSGSRLHIKPNYLQNFSGFPKDNANRFGTYMKQTVR